MGKERLKNLELLFVSGFSVLVFTVFYSLLGANGMVLGNDPAVHLQTAQNFLNIGQIPVSDNSWYTPLYHVVLDTFICFTGITNTGNLLVLLKAVTALIDWLLVLSVYVAAAKFLRKPTGVLASSLILLCFPLFELNAWGGYTSILSMVFIVTSLTYLSLPLRGLGNTLVAFILAFSLVLSHQLATFLAVFILPPFILIVLATSKGRYSKALIAAIIGGIAAFAIYYVKPIFPYLGELVSIIFFQLTVYLYQLPFVTFDAFMVYFGFVIFFAFAGLILAFFKLREQRALNFFMLLSLTFLVPLIFSQSYLIGLLLPYQRFVYFLLPPLAILAAIPLCSLIELIFAAFKTNKNGCRSITIKGLSIIIVVMLAALMAMRINTVSMRIGEATVFYDTSDVSAFQAGTWITQNFPDPLTGGVVTQKPGNWFRVYSGTNVIAETDSTVDWSFEARCVLDLSYELTHPLTTVKVFEAKSNSSGGNWIFRNMAWTSATYFDLKNAYFIYRDEDDTLYWTMLSDLNRTISMENVNDPKKIRVTYTGDYFVINQTISMEKDEYPVTVTWEISAKERDLNYVVLNLNEHFDQSLNFSKINVPGVLDWTDPRSNPTKYEDDYIITQFTGQDLTDNWIGAYDEDTQSAFALKFQNLPDTGNVGQSVNGRIDAVRWAFEFYKIKSNSAVTETYQTLTFSLTSYTQLETPWAMNTLFDIELSEPFEVQSRNFASIISTNKISFIVYNTKRFDPQLLSSGWVQLAYTNDQYIVLTIKSNPPTPNVFN